MSRFDSCGYFLLSFRAGLMTITHSSKERRRSPRAWHRPGARRWENRSAFCDSSKGGHILVRLTLKAADQGPDPLPEEEVAKLGMLIATERQRLIDAMTGLLEKDEPDAVASPGVAKFDAGLLYGFGFAPAVDDARIALNRVQRGRVPRLATGKHVTCSGPLEGTLRDPQGSRSSGLVPLTRRAPAISRSRRHPQIRRGSVFAPYRGNYMPRAWRVACGSRARLAAAPTAGAEQAQRSRSRDCCINYWMRPRG